MQLPVIAHIADLLEPHQPAVAFFTRGEQFDVAHGYTGAWRIMPARILVAMIVVVYLRANHQNTVYVSNAGALEGPFDDNGRNRYGIHLAHLHIAGVTNNNWMVCAQTGTNPVRYFNA